MIRMKNVGIIIIIAVSIIAIAACNQTEDKKPQEAAKQKQEDTAKKPAFSYTAPDQQQDGIPMQQPEQGQGQVINESFDLNELLTKHFNALGQSKLTKTSTIIQEGTLSQPGGMETKVLMKYKRPLKSRMEISMQGQTMVQAYDGKKGWGLVPMQGKNNIVDITGKPLDQIKEQADFDGILYNWEKKLKSVVPDGFEMIDGKKAYRLKVTKKSGNIIYVYIDPNSYLTLKSTEMIKTPQYNGMAEIRFGNYKRVDGISIAHEMNFVLNNQSISRFIFSKITLNQDIDDKEFQKPE
jgi:hypothetical protein